MSSEGTFEPTKRRNQPDSTKRPFHNGSDVKRTYEKGNSASNIRFPCPKAYREYALGNPTSEVLINKITSSAKVVPAAEIKYVTVKKPDVVEQLNNYVQKMKKETDETSTNVPTEATVGKLGVALYHALSCDVTWMTPGDFPSYQRNSRGNTIFQQAEYYMSLPSLSIIASRSDTVVKIPINIFLDCHLIKQFANVTAESFMEALKESTSLIVENVNETYLVSNKLLEHIPTCLFTGRKYLRDYGISPYGQAYTLLDQPSDSNGETVVQEMKKAIASETSGEYNANWFVLENNIAIENIPEVWDSSKHAIGHMFCLDVIKLLPRLGGNPRMGSTVQGCNISYSYLSNETWRNNNILAKVSSYISYLACLQINHMKFSCSEIPECKTLEDVDKVPTCYSVEDINDAWKQTIESNESILRSTSVSGVMVEMIPWGRYLDRVESSIPTDFWLDQEFSTFKYYYVPTSKSKKPVTAKGSMFGLMCDILHEII